MQPSSRSVSAEPELSLADYDQILEVIQSMVKVFERSPSVFKSMNEEDLRTILLIALNGVFQGNATGETFNGIGDTDILIRVKDTNIFMTECPIWSGPEHLRIIGHRCRRERDQRRRRRGRCGDDRDSDRFGRCFCRDPTDSLKGEKNGTQVAALGSLLVESTDALKSTVTGSPRAAAVYPLVAGNFAAACFCARDSVTVNELSFWSTDSLDGVI